MQRNVPSKSLQSCDVFLLAGGGGGYNSNFLPTLPQTLFVGLSGFSPREAAGGGGGRAGVGQNREQNV